MLNRTTGIVIVAGLLALSGAPALGDEGHGGNAEKGERVFNKCKACHSLEEGRNKIGPTLYGVFGRAAGAVEGYKYSDALKDSGLTWTDETMDAYVKDPRGYVKGTRMSFRGLNKEDDRKDLITYLKEETHED